MSKFHSPSQNDRLAGKHIRERYPEDPIREFADKIKGLAGSKAKA